MIIRSIAVALWGLGLGIWSPAASAQSLSSCTLSSPCVGYDWGAPGGTSTTSYMESHRFQRHSVVTSDGYIHIIVNTGTVQTVSTGSGTATGALILYTSANNGGTWYPSYVFSGTVGSQPNGAVSTDDVHLVTNGTGQYLEVAYDQEAVSGVTGVVNAVIFTELAYSPSNAQPATRPTWTVMSGYPQTVTPIPNTSGTTYQQPAFAEDGSLNTWLTDFEIPSSGTAGGQIGVYEYSSSDTGWVNTTLGISLPCSGSGSNGGSGSGGSCTGGNPDTTGTQHASRPVFVPLRRIYTTTPANIGVIYQSNNCLFWVTINVNNSPQVSTAQELSNFSNASANPGNTGCNLPDAQSSYDDTAASIATNPTTGDQYLGFAVNVTGSTDASPLTNVYTLTYQASTATWMTSNGQLWAGPTSHPDTPVYVKSALITPVGSSTTYAYMFINYGALSWLEVLTAPILSATVTSTSYAPFAYLSHSQATGASYDNPRIDVPEYLNTSISGNLSVVPAWEQYVISTTSGAQSLIYWNNVPN